MTLTELSEMDCVEEELSDIQASYYSSALKEHEKAMEEANNIQKDSLSVTKNGNVWVVKSAYHVRVHRSIPPASAPNNSSTLPTGFGLQNSAVPKTSINPAVTSKPHAPPVSSTPLSANPQAKQSIVVRPSTQPNLMTTPPIDQSIFPASQLLSKFTETSTKSLKVVSGAFPTTQVSDHSQPVTQIILAPQPAQPLRKTANVQPVQIFCQNQTSETPSPSSVSTPNSTTINQSSKPTAAITNVTKKTTANKASDDSKFLQKNIPSLTVVVRPANAVSDVVNQKKREALDQFVKSRLVLDTRRFAEWLMQVGLLRSQQFGFCRVHPSSSPEPLQLRMYPEETSRFPYSGGYVWITKCCDRNYVSIFRDSIFEDSAHPPTVLLKLIYHWACQTPVANVVQWVKIDHTFLRLFYGLLRSVCTVEIHSTTPTFGLAEKNARVEIGVISLGTTSSDGKRRDVKVEVLGVLDQETKKIRLRASEPITGDVRSRSRFAKILEPLSKWVDKNATILTDYTVDRGALEELGFQNIIQKNINTATTFDRLTNRGIMEYLRKTVPKVFQNTLSLLSTTTIQQFLDELVWRETHGQSSAEACHDLLRDLSYQARADTGISLIKRLHAVALDPFKDWKISQYKSSKTSPSEARQAQAIPPVVPAIVTATVKRPAPTPSADKSSAKEMRSTSYYSTMQDKTKQPLVSSPEDAFVNCQHSGCGQLIKTNIDMMLHMRQHLVKGLAAEKREWIEHCIYCLETEHTAASRILHENNNHTFILTLKEQKSRYGSEEVAVVMEIVCLICHEKFQNARQLESHLDKTHVYCEMPYRCKVCHFKTSVHQQLIEHFYAHHKTTSFLLCPLCLDTFNTKGDNRATGLNTGHLQYLQHLRNHLSIPMNNRHKCKRCVLTFYQYDELRFHVRTDHISSEANPDARPFSFSIAKSFTPKVDLLSAPTVVINNTSLTLASNLKMVSPTSSNNLPNVGLRSSARTYGKDVAQEIPNTNVARRFSNVTLAEETVEMSSLCIECNEPLKKKNHFTGYLCCTLCRFSTCCAIGMKKHQNHVHKGQIGPMLGVVYELSQVVKCECGFSSSSGIEVSQHLALCGRHSVTISS